MSLIPHLQFSLYTYFNWVFTFLVLQRLLLSKSLLTTPKLLNPMMHSQSTSYFMSQQHLQRSLTSSPPMHFLPSGSKTQDSLGFLTHCLFRFSCWILLLPEPLTSECPSPRLQSLLSKCFPGFGASNVIHMPTPNPYV